MNVSMTKKLIETVNVDTFCNVGRYNSVLADLDVGVKHVVQNHCNGVVLENVY